MNNVIKLEDVKPKTVKSVYKKIPITLTYLPNEGKWKWSIKIITETTYSEVSENEIKAKRAAQKYIDKHGIGKG